MKTKDIKQKKVLFLFAAFTIFTDYNPKYFVIVVAIVATEYIKFYWCPYGEIAFIFSYSICNYFIDFFPLRLPLG